MRGCSRPRRLPRDGSRDQEMPGRLVDDAREVDLCGVRGEGQVRREGPVLARVEDGDQALLEGNGRGHDDAAAQIDGPRERVDEHDGGPVDGDLGVGVLVKVVSWANQRPQDSAPPRVTSATNLPMPALLTGIAPPPENEIAPPFPRPATKTLPPSSSATLVGIKSSTPLLKLCAQMSLPEASSLARKASAITSPPSGARITGSVVPAMSTSPSKVPATTTSPFPAIATASTTAPAMPAQRSWRDQSGAPRQAPTASQLLWSGFLTHRSTPRRRGPGFSTTRARGTGGGVAGVGLAVARGDAGRGPPSPAPPASPPLPPRRPRAQRVTVESVARAPRSRRRLKPTALQTLRRRDPHGAYHSPCALRLPPPRVLRPQQVDR